MSLLFMFLLATSLNLNQGVPWLRILKQSWECNSCVGLSIICKWPARDSLWIQAHQPGVKYLFSAVCGWTEILWSNHLFNKAYSARTFTISDFVVFGPYQVCKQFLNELFLFFFQQKLRSVQQGLVNEEFSAKRKFRKAKDLVYPRHLSRVGLEKVQEQVPSSNRLWKEPSGK